MKIYFIDWVMKCKCFIPKLSQMQMFAVDCEGLTLLFFKNDTHW